MSSRTTSAHETKATEWFHGFAIAEQQITIPRCVHTRGERLPEFSTRAFSKPFRLAAPNIREEYVPEGSSDTIYCEQIKNFIGTCRTFYTVNGIFCYAYGH